MKITLDAHIKEHREIGLVLGAMVSQKYNQFVIEKPISGGNQFRVKYEDKITIDLDQAQMDLRMAIGTGIEFVLGGGHIAKISELSINHVTGKLGKCSYCVGDAGDFVSHYFTRDLHRIKLCPDYLKSVGVEVAE